MGILGSDPIPGYGAELHFSYPKKLSIDEHHPKIAWENFGTLAGNRLKFRLSSLGIVRLYVHFYTCELMLQAPEHVGQCRGRPYKMLGDEATGEPRLNLESLEELRELCSELKHLGFQHLDDCVVFFVVMYTSWEKW